MDAFKISFQRRNRGRKTVTVTAENFVSEGIASRNPFGGWQIRLPKISENLIVDSLDALESELRHKWLPFRRLEQTFRANLADGFALLEKLRGPSKWNHLVSPLENALKTGQDLLDEVVQLFETDAEEATERVLLYFGPLNYLLEKTKIQYEESPC